MSALDDLLAGQGQPTGVRYADLEAPGFLTTLKRSGGQMMGGLGEIVGDVSGNQENALARMADDIIARNPSGINLLSDIADNPVLAAKEAGANALTFLVPYLGAGKALQVLRAGPAATAAVQAAIAGVPSLGEIGESQRETGEINTPLKYAGAGAVGAIENLLGVQRMMGPAGKNMTEAAARAAVADPLKTFGKQWLRSGAEEGFEEVLQTPIERVTGGKAAFDDQGVDETLLGGAMGAIGGIVLGPLGAGAHRSQASGLTRQIDEARATLAAPLQALDQLPAKQSAADFLKTVTANDFGSARALEFANAQAEAGVQDRDVLLEGIAQKADAEKQVELQKAQQDAAQTAAAERQKQVDEFIKSLESDVEAAAKAEETARKDKLAAEGAARTERDSGFIRPTMILPDAPMPTDLLGDPLAFPVAQPAAAPVPNLNDFITQGLDIGQRFQQASAAGDQNTAGLLERLAQSVVYDRMAQGLGEAAPGQLPLIGPKGGVTPGEAAAKSRRVTPKVQVLAAQAAGQINEEQALDLINDIDQGAKAAVVVQRLEAARGTTRSNPAVPPEGDTQGSAVAGGGVGVAGPVGSGADVAGGGQVAGGVPAGEVAAAPVVPVAQEAVAPVVKPTKEKRHGRKEKVPVPAQNADEGQDADEEEALLKKGGARGVEVGTAGEKDAGQIEEGEVDAQATQAVEDEQTEAPQGASETAAVRRDELKTRLQAVVDNPKEPVARKRKAAQHIDLLADPALNETAEDVATNLKVVEEFVASEQERAEDEAAKLAPRLPPNKGWLTNFSRTVPAEPAERTTVGKIKSALRGWFITPEAAAARLTVVRSYNDLSPDVQAQVQEGLASKEGFKPVDTESAEFKRWFGDSKVVDADGKPLRVYHGSPQDVKQFKSSATLLAETGNSDKYVRNHGIFFTSDPVFAVAYANKEGESATTHPVFLCLKNPLRVKTAYDSAYFSEARIADLTSKGYDGAYYDGTGSGLIGYNEYVVFEPTQIKSAISNTGEFSSTNPNIQFSYTMEDAQDKYPDVKFDAYVTLEAPAFVKKRTYVAGYWVNPTQSTLLKAVNQMTRADHDGDMRMMQDANGDTYVFPAADATHSMMEEGLKLEGVVNLKLFPSGTIRTMSPEAFGQNAVLPKGYSGQPQWQPSMAARIQAFVLNGHAYMIADNIKSGNEMAVFMHEVGSHIGLAGQEAQIMERVNLWAAEPFGSPEREVFDKMQARMKAAGEVTDSEKVAYAIEEAVKSGVTPKAVKMGMKLSEASTVQDLVNWFAHYFKQAVQRMFGNNTRGFNAQNLVDLAYGAAREALVTPEVGAGETAVASKEGFKPVDTESAAFKKWFGDSKVVDEDGQPLKLYTGTSKDKDFLKFNVPKNGVWLTTDQESASMYAKDNDSKNLKYSPDTRSYDHLNTADRVIPVFASVKNPYPLTAEDQKLLMTASNYKRAQGIVFEKAKARGHDGVDFGGGTWVVIQSPTQIKSAVSNTGEFSSTNPNIQFSLATDLPEQAARYAGPSGVQLWNDVKNLTRKAVLDMTSLPDLVRRYEDRIPALRKMYDAMLAAQTRKIELDQQVDTIMQKIEEAKLTQGQIKTINEFLLDSTTEQKWAYDPGFKRKVDVDPEFEARFNALPPAHQAIIKGIFRHGEDTMEQKRNVFKALGIVDPFKRLTQVPGPYAPLRRFGSYMVEVKSPALVAEEAKQKTDDGGFKDTKKIDELRADPDNYRISFRTTEGAAKRLYNDLQATGRYSPNPKHSYVGVRPERAYTHSEITRSSLVKVLESIKGDDSLSRDIRSKMENSIKDIYHQMMEDNLARQSMRQRKYRAGADEDMLQGFFKQARAEAAFIANMEHAQKINEATYEVSNNKETLAKEQRLQDVVNTMIVHRQRMLDFKDTPVQDFAVGMTSAMQLATSPGYHFANATQVAMKSIPMLASEFNDYSGAWKHVMDGYKLFGKMKSERFDWSKIPNEGLRKTLEMASKMNLIDVGMAEDFDQYNTPRTGYANVDAGLNQGRKVLHKLRQMSRWVERANRVTSAAAAYNMAREKGRTHEQAQTFAIRVLEQTQGDFSQLAAPLIIKRLPKFVTQYRKYQLMVAALYVRGAYDAFANSSPAERAVARRMLGYMLAHTAMVGGVLGLPLINLAELVIPALFGDEDEPKDLERMLRDWFGDDQGMADFLLKGPLSATLGLDLGAKLSDDRVFSILPYTNLELSKKGIADALVGLMGPGMAQASKMIDGVALLNEGQLEQGTEKLMPRVFEDAMKGYRMANEGITLRNGDVLVKPEDIDAFQAILQGVGLPPAQIKRYQWIKGQQIEITKFYKERESDLKREYIAATRDGEATSDIEDQWLSLQETKHKMRRYFGDQTDELKSHPLKPLRDAPARQKEREAKRQETMGAK